MLCKKGELIDIGKVTCGCGTATNNKPAAIIHLTDRYCSVAINVFNIHHVVTLLADCSRARGAAGCKALGCCPGNPGAGVAEPVG